MRWKRNRELNIFSLSMIDVILGSLGSFLIIIFVLYPHYNKEKSNVIELSKEIDKKDRIIEKNKREIEQLNTSLLREHKKIELQVQKNIEELKAVVNSKNVLLKDRNIILILDRSGSMEWIQDRSEELKRSENKFLSLKAGLKLLVATMDESHKIDIILFPFETKPYSPVFGKLKRVSKSLKYEIFDHIDKLTISNKGGTPIFKTLEHVLRNSNYSEVGSIFLLTDGEPDRVKDPTDIENFVNSVIKINKDRKKINTIGVGREFLNEDIKSVAYNLLLELSRKNSGFYVGYAGF